MDTQELIQCYNIGCGQKFNPTKNDQDSCTYHSGSPFFHDAYKSWNCCNKKSTDFTTWLSFPGCTKGLHNPEKPIEPAVSRQEGSESLNSSIEVNQYVPPINSPQNLLESSREEKEMEPLIPLQKTINSNLLDLISQRQNLESTKLKNGDFSCESVVIGTKCRNNACGSMYSGPDNNDETCHYHPGTPIFHEGDKFWSCCKKKTVNFDDFLEQKGCSIGGHCWSTTDNVKSTKKCRQDWYSRGDDVEITFYAKGVLPSQTEILANSVQLRGNINYEFGNSRHSFDYSLWGDINPNASRVVISEKKVEICLKKVEPIKWPKLEH